MHYWCHQKWWHLFLKNPKMSVPAKVGVTRMLEIVVLYSNHLLRYRPNLSWNQYGQSRAWTNCTCICFCLLFFDFPTEETNTIQSRAWSNCTCNCFWLLFFDFPTQNQLSLESLNSQKGTVTSTSLSYLAERGRIFCARLQFDSCLVPFMDRRCLLTDLPKCFHLSNDTSLSMTQD